ncbi:unnamed protein product, partial [Allacma fusca]
MNAVFEKATNNGKKLCVSKIPNLTKQTLAQPNPGNPFRRNNPWRLYRTMYIFIIGYTGLNDSRSSSKGLIKPRNVFSTDRKALNDHNNIHQFHLSRTAGLKFITSDNVKALCAEMELYFLPFEPELWFGLAITATIIAVALSFIFTSPKECKYGIVANLIFLLGGQLLEQGA